MRTWKKAWRNLLVLNSVSFLPLEVGIGNVFKRLKCQIISGPKGNTWVKISLKSKKWVWKKVRWGPVSSETSQSDGENERSLPAVALGPTALQSFAKHYKKGFRHRVGRVLSFFSSRRNWESPNSDKRTYTVVIFIYTSMYFVVLDILLSNDDFHKRR